MNNSKNLCFWKSRMAQLCCTLLSFPVTAHLAIWVFWRQRHLKAALGAVPLRQGMKGCAVFLAAPSPTHSKEEEKPLYNTSTPLDKLHTKDLHRNWTSLYAFLGFLEAECCELATGADALVGGYRNMAVAVTITVTHEQPEILLVTKPANYQLQQWAGC